RIAMASNRGEFLSAEDPGNVQGEDGTSVRAVRYEYSPHFAAILEHLGCSLLVSTYQAGKLVVVSASQGSPELSFHNCERAMGVAVRPDRVAVGSTALIWLLWSAPELAPRIEPVGRHDACFLTRSAHYTGEIQGHEMVWASDELWIVNTLFS